VFICHRCFFLASSFAGSDPRINERARKEGRKGSIHNLDKGETEKGKNGAHQAVTEWRSDCVTGQKANVDLLHA
jgi:hypothetical protein